MHLPPINKLDPQQQAFIDKISASVNKSDAEFSNQWICGFAGSGKSVLLVYTVKTIIAKNPNANILVVVFTRSLVEMFKADFKELGLDSILITTYYEFHKSFYEVKLPYDYILCDEVQDFVPCVISEMNKHCKKVIVAGDSNQSIYEKDPRWGSMTVKSTEIPGLINGTKYELSIIHRLTKSIINAVQLFLPEMNILSSKQDMTKEDTQIRLCKANTEVEEVKYVMEQAIKAINVGDTVAILIPRAPKIVQFVNIALQNAGKSQWVEQTNQWGKVDFGVMNRYLKDSDIKMQYVGNGYGNFDENDRRINIMTFHSAKGLDFDNVFIPFANNSMYICPNDATAKTLFMVAMTRARKNLYITYSGYPSDYLDSFKSKCSQIDVSSTKQFSSTNNNIWGF